MRNHHFFSAATLSITIIAPAGAGDLVPPVGPVSPSHKTLTEVEPRTPVQSLPGDAASVHIINQPGSYYLTANIDAPAAMNAISIEAPDVTLDLCGFAIISPGGGSVSGVNAVFPSARVCVKNGALRGWTFAGVSLPEDSRISGVIVSGCNLAGIITSRSCFVEDCIATACLIGIQTGAGSHVARCIAEQCSQTGFALSDGPGIIENCIARSNAGSGLSQNCCSGLVIRNCEFISNGIHGVDLCASNVIVGNVFRSNGTATTTGAGVNSRCGGQTIDGNNFEGNDRGVTLSANSKEVVIRNTFRSNAGGNIINPTGNDVGPIGTAAAATSPWANIAN